MACVTKYREKWAVDYREFGKRKRLTFSNKKDAQQMLREIRLREMDKSHGITPVSPVELCVATDRYLKTITSQKASKRATVGEAKYMGRLLAFFDGYETTEIQLQDLEELQAELARKLKASTVNRHFNCYRHFFGKCVDWKFIKNNPCDRLKGLRQKAVKRRVVTPGELEQLMSGASEWMRNILLFTSLTGCRASEVSGLNWESVNLDERSVRIYSKKGTGDERERLLPLSEACHRLMCDIASRSFKKPKTAVFRNSSGKRVTAEHIVRETRRLASKSGLKGVSIHCLRHTFATNLSLDGNNLEVVQKLLGHTNLQTTSRYLHQTTEQMRAAVEGLGSKRKV